MCAKKEDCAQAMSNNTQDFQEHLLLQHQNADCTDMFGSSHGSSGAFVFPQESNFDASQPAPWSSRQLPYSFNPPVHFLPNPPNQEADLFLLPPHPSYGSFFNRRPQFGYQGMAPTSNTNNQYYQHHEHGLRILSEALGPVVQTGAGQFGFQAELGKMTAQEIMDAKALAASKSHSEAERRRRERINNHLAKLRSILPSTTKTDKASLLAEVIQHVKELKRQTSLISESSPVPTENDDLTVDASSDVEEGGRFVIRASLCCDDRTDLLPDLIKILKSLRLRTLKAEITTLAGRVRNVLFVTSDEDPVDDSSEHRQHCMTSIQEAFKAVMEKSATEESSSGSTKRQRTSNISTNNNNTNTNNSIAMLEQQHM